MDGSVCRPPSWSWVGSSAEFMHASCANGKSVTVVPHWSLEFLLLTHIFFERQCLPLLKSKCLILASTYLVGYSSKSVQTGYQKLPFWGDFPKPVKNSVFVKVRWMNASGKLLQRNQSWGRKCIAPASCFDGLDISTGHCLCDPHRVEIRMEGREYVLKYPSALGSESQEG